MSMTGSGVGTSVSDGVAFVGDIVGLFVGGGGHNVREWLAILGHLLARFKFSNN